MREILFRGKRIADGAWVEGDFEHFFTAAGIHCYVGKWGERPNVVDPATVGQYTGLRDKHGKMIFEGDIVKFTDSPFGYSNVGVVCFKACCFCIKFKGFRGEIFLRLGEQEKWQEMGASGTVTYQYEILGKVYDNPELLEEVKSNAEV